ncbi:MAG: ATP-dependent DNA ligase, partial [Dehalococcoidia bacterium]|nr:ATP-dependent DNA ligase [Dehalococcoidia bacterium]
VNAPATWVRPELVAEIRFNSWTEGGYLRAPSFMRLREDKAPWQAGGIELVPERTGPESASRAPYPGTVGEVLEQVQSGGETLVLKVEGHSIPVNNLGKVLWPAEKGPRPLTKRDLLVYLARVSPYLLPHLRDRPLTLSRFPNGIHGEQFFQKHWPDSLPAFVDTVDLYSEHKDSFQQYLICDNLATLLWLGQIADLELHTWFSRTNPEPDMIEGLDRSPNEIVDYPDFIIFDIDPYIYSGKEAGGAEPELNREAFARTVQVAGWLKEILDSFSLSAFIKTSGKTGLHVHVPIIRKLDFTAIRSIAGTIGRFLMRDHPREITMEWTVEKRTGKVFFDHNQNSRGKTLSSIYSPRPAPDATVSMAVKWEELDRIYPTDFTILNCPERLDETGDLWSDILEAKKDIQALLEAGSL